MARRRFFSQLAALPFLAASTIKAQLTHKPLNIMMKSAWGSDDPPKAAFPFLHGLALAEAGHDVRIFLLGEAVSLMRKSRYRSHPGWLATPGGDAGQGHCQAHSNLCLRRLLPGSGGDRGGLEHVRSEIWQSHYFRIFDRMG